MWQKERMVAAQLEEANRPPPPIEIFVRCFNGDVHTLADDLAAFAQHRKGKVITHDDVLLAVRKMPSVLDGVHAVLPPDLVAKKSRQPKLTL